MWTTILTTATTVGGKLLGKFTGKGTQKEQIEVNKEELKNAPSSILRLWRPFLGWALSLLFVWEIVGRLILIPWFFQGIEDSLPPSALKHIMKLLMGMLGI